MDRKSTVPMKEDFRKRVDIFPKTMSLLVGLGMLLVLTATSYAAPRVWIQFEQGQKAAVKRALLQVGGQIHHEFDNLEAIAATVPTGALDGLRRNPNVVLIEADPPRYLSEQTVPYGIDRVQARDVWDFDTDAPTGAGRLVCIIDSGLYIGHEDLAAVDGSPNDWNTDFCGHGTHVAGTINAVNNDLGVVGVSPGVSLYILKVFGDDCSGVSSSDLVAAADRCKTEGADIINMSLGGPFKSRTEQRAFQQLYDAGILSVAAAGNDGNNRKSYPASYDSVISVAAIDENDEVADFSQQNDKVELSAPGVGVLSTVPWLNTLTVETVTYQGHYIENAALGTVSGGVLVDGGLCEAGPWWPGAVVLCERGNSTFNEKVTNVEAGGGVAAVIYNNEPGTFFGTLGEGNSSAIPAISLSREDGWNVVEIIAGISPTSGDVVSEKPDSGYEEWGGTSMATAHVSGVAALVWSSASYLSNTDIRHVLQETALDLGESGKDNAYGYGLVQALTAWEYLETPSGSDNPPPVSGDEPPVDSDDTPPVITISDSPITPGRGGSFTIIWTTNELADSEVRFDFGSVFTNSELVINHSMSFRGKKGYPYELWVRSTDAAGNEAPEEGPFPYTVN